MDYQLASTAKLRDDISRCEDMNEILNCNSSTSIRWKNYINQLLAEHGYSEFKLAKKCGFSDKTIKKWSEKGDMPKGRKEFIKLGFGLGMDLAEMNKLLRRYGKYPRLYTKNIEDAIYIFSLTNKESFKYAIKLKSYIDTLTAVQPGFLSEPKIINTSVLLKGLQSMVSDAELIEFISLNIDLFNDGYRKLIEFFDSHIEKMTKDYTGASQNTSINMLLKGKLVNSKQVARYNELISSLRNGRIIPSRLRMVALGIILEMDINEIDKLLELSGMEGLCAKDRLESILIFILEDYMINDPGDLIGNLYEKLWNNLGKQSKDKYICIIEKYKREDECSNYSDSDISDYMIRMLSDIEIDEIRDFLDYL